MSKFTDKIDMRFKYTTAAATDVRKTIAREQKRLADLKLAQEKADAEAKAKITAISRVRT